MIVIAHVMEAILIDFLSKFEILVLLPKVRDLSQSTKPINYLGQFKVTKHTSPEEKQQFFPTIFC